MKKILITGANSYIGTSFDSYMKQFPDEYQIDTADMIGDSWRNKDFSGYDVVFHVAGIAHIKETKENAQLYYKVNRDLAIEVATKANNENVAQLIFLSSMSVYGLIEGVISRDTKPNPNTNYGKSKLQAEEAINKIGSESFQVAIIRPPMVYGNACKGNYQRLKKLVSITPIFPFVNNKRSMIYIENLCEFVKQTIDNNFSGLFFPQNKNYVCTHELVSLIAQYNKKKLFVFKGFGWLIKLTMKFSRSLKKVFGSLVYEISMSDNPESYNVCNFKNSIMRTEFSE